MPAAYIDVTSLASALTVAGQRADLAVGAAIRGAALQIQHEAQQKAPKRTGALASSITVTFHGPLTAEIGPTVNYGVFQEFGTRGPYEIRPKRSDGYLVFEVNGTLVHTRRVVHPGLKARPFMRPAAQDVIGNLVNQVGGIGVKMVVEGDVNGGGAGAEDAD